MDTVAVIVGVRNADKGDEEKDAYREGKKYHLRLELLSNKVNGKMSGGGGCVCVEGVFVCFVLCNRRLQVSEVPLQPHQAGQTELLRARIR